MCIVNLQKRLSSWIEFEILLNPFPPPNCACAQLPQLHLALCDPMDSLSMGFSRQEYWSWLPWLPFHPRDLPYPQTKSAPPAWQADSLPMSHLGSLSSSRKYLSKHSLGDL